MLPDIGNILAGYDLVPPIDVFALEESGTNNTVHGEGEA
jgi:hypothetical protein